MHRYLRHNLQKKKERKRASDNVLVCRQKVTVYMLTASCVLLACRWQLLEIILNRTPSACIESVK